MVRFNQLSFLGVFARILIYGHIEPEIRTKPSATKASTY